jgi:circadian clock protein KaiB
LPIEFVLYVSAASPSSVRAVANLRRILRQYRSRDVKVTVCDLTRDPGQADRDQIAFTPTLYKRRPEPPMWILGDLSQPAPLVELLEYYGVQPTNEHSQTHDRDSGI